MSESQEDLLKSLRRHARINTALQTGALVELEAQRRELTAQTSLMEAAQHREHSREQDQELLHLWRGWIADAEDAEGDPVKQFVLLYQVEDLIADIPRTASLDEMGRAKRLLRRKDELLDVIRSREVERVARLEAWWQRNKAEERIRTLEPVGERISAAIDSAARMPDRAAAIERLENARRLMISFDQEMLALEGAENLDPYDRVLTVALHGLDGEFLWQHGSGDRSRLLEKIHATLESLKDAERKEELAEKAAQSRKTFHWVMFGIFSLLIFIFILSMQSDQ
jgi:hypothetical protein